MRDSADNSRNLPARRLAVVGVVLVAAALSCGKDVTGPVGDAGRFMRALSWNPVFPPVLQQAAGGASSGVVPFSRVRIVLHHSNGTVALDTTINFPANADSLTVPLAVRLLNDAPPDGETMQLNLGYINAAGDTVFRGGPVSVLAAPPPRGGGANPPVRVPLAYTGVGASAVALTVSPPSSSVLTGSAFSFSAVAADDKGVTIPGTPIVWSSLDPTIATITSPAAGAGLAQNQRGTARIVAQLLTGPADTVRLTVLLPASQIVAQAGNAQSGVAGAALAQPLVVKVEASDGVGVAGVAVNFVVASGGGSVSAASVVSDADGLSQTTFRLGTGAGPQSVTATSGTLANSPLTFTATAVAATASKLVFTVPPANGVAGVALTAVAVSAEDNNGNVATTFNGPVTIAIGANPGAGMLAGTTTVSAIAGVATFPTLSINRNGTAYTLLASATGLTSATSGPFDIAVGPATKLAFTAQPGIGIVNAPLSMPIVVHAEDSQGNLTPAFGGTVTIAFATNPTGAALGGLVSVDAVAGIAAFSGITVSQAGNGYTLSASATGLTSATSAPFNIGTGVAMNLSVVGGNNQSALPGATLAQPIMILVSDGAGNGIAGSTVTFVVDTGGGATSPTSGVSNSSGIVQTTWTLGALGSQDMTATSVGLSGSPLHVSATATATVVGATRLRFTTQPSSVAAVTLINPAIVVSAQDASNNLASGFSGSVTLAFGANPGGATLGGTTTVSAVGGIATFGDISLNKAATGYTLTAVSGALTPDLSAPFNISAGPPATLGPVSPQNQFALLPGTVLTVQVIVRDANFNPVPNQLITWGSITGGGSVNPPTSMTDATGVATAVWTLGSSPHSFHNR